MNQKKIGSHGKVLSGAISAWKAQHASALELSSEARHRVLGAAVSGPSSSDMHRISTLFPTYRRFALAAILPAALLAVVLAVSLGRNPAPASVTITVEKVGNQVVFNIANGGTAHSVSRSNTPHSFDPGNAVRVENGAYRDSVVENGNLVFYRID